MLTEQRHTQVTVASTNALDFNNTRHIIIIHQSTENRGSYLGVNGQRFSAALHFFKDAKKKFRGLTFHMPVTNFGL